MVVKAKTTPADDTSDMSIDELSAAIDAHMDDIGKKKPKKEAEKVVVDVPAEDPKKPTSKKITTAKAEDKAETETKVEVGAEVEDKIEVKVAPKKKETSKPEKKTDEKQTKITVKRGYVTKTKEPEEVLVPTKEEKEPISQTSKVELKPISSTSEPKEAEKKAVAPEKNIVDVVVKKKTAVEVKPAPKPEETKEEVEEVVVEGPEEEKPEPEKEQEEPEERKPALAPIPVRGNNEAELNAQMPNQQITESEPEEGRADSHSLKTFDTKQYHIPIKPSHHHKKGGSFKVFIAVFAAILAIIFVLSELEYIGLANLVVK